MDQNKVSQCVDALCLNGCEAVRALIRTMEADIALQETAGLDEEEKHAVLTELQAIMAVYDARAGETDQPAPRRSEKA
jgi:hypothetical protein